MYLFQHQKPVLLKVFFLLASILLFSGAWSCGSGGGQTVSGQSSSVDEAGTDVSACLNGPSIDFTSVFAGPCDVKPGDNVNHTASDTISYADLLFIANKESADPNVQTVVDCVAKEAYCTGETQCLTIATICQFASNCGADSNPCLDGTGACHATKVDSCESVTSKSACIASYQDKCEDASGNNLDCNNPSSTIVHQDSHNCFWGVDHQTNKTGCFSYGVGVGDSACTPQ